MKTALILAALLTTSSAFAVDCSTGPQPQDGCMIIDGQSRPIVVSGDRPNIGVDEVANSCLASQAVCEQQVALWHEWFRRAVVAFGQAKAKCGRKCRNVRIEGL